MTSYRLCYQKYYLTYLAVCRAYCSQWNDAIRSSATTQVNYVNASAELRVTVGWLYGNNTPTTVYTQRDGDRLISGLVLRGSAVDIYPRSIQVWDPATSCSVRISISDKSHCGWRLARGNLSGNYAKLSICSDELGHTFRVGKLV